jgi:ribonuclease HI
MGKWDAEIWTDGSQDKNRYGGCAAIIVASSGKRMILTGGELSPTTNQRMELQAAIIALNGLWWRPHIKTSIAIRRKKSVIIYSDSAYLTNCFNQKWIEQWRKKKWITSTGDEVKNRELWEILDALVSMYKKVQFVHVKGHNGNVMNEIADQEAVKARIAFSIRGARLVPGSDAYESARNANHRLTESWHRRISRETKTRSGREREL